MSRLLLQYRYFATVRVRSAGRMDVPHIFEEREIHDSSRLLRVQSSTVRRYIVSFNGSLARTLVLP